MPSVVVWRFGFSLFFFCLPWLLKELIENHPQKFSKLSLPGLKRHNFLQPLLNTLYNIFKDPVVDVSPVFKILVRKKEENVSIEKYYKEIGSLFRHVSVMDSNGQSKPLTDCIRRQN